MRLQNKGEVTGIIFSFMRHKYPVLTVKKLLKSVYIYGSYRKNKIGVPFFLDHPVGPYANFLLIIHRAYKHAYVHNNVIRWIMQNHFSHLFIRSQVINERETGVGF